MSKLSILQEEKRTEFEEWFDREDIETGGEIGQLDIFDAVEAIVKSTYLAAIEDAIAAVPTDKNHTHTDIYRDGFNDCKKEFLTRLEALKRV